MSNKSRVFYAIILIVSIIFVSNFSYSQALNGSYTIGGSSPNYSTISAAVSALTTNGVSGPVVFNIRNGTYVEQFSIGSISGASAINTIVFQSQNKDSSLVTIQYSPNSSSTYIVQLNGSKYITFSQLSFYADGNTYANVFKSVSNPSDISVKNCVLTGSSAASGSNDLILFYAVSQVKNLNFMNNVFSKGSKAISLNNGSENIVIRSNHFSNQYASAITCSEGKSILIERNTLSSATNYSIYEMVSLSKSGNNLKISGNNFYISNGLYALKMQLCTATDSTYGIISNNIFVSSFGPTALLHVINLESCSYQKILYNSVNCQRQNDNSSIFNASAGTSSYLVVKNNNFYKANKGYVLITNNYGDSCYSNYNNLMSKSGNVALFRNSVQKTLANYISISGLETKSVSVDPLYKTSYDLYPQNYLLDNKGFPDDDILTDYNEKVRPLSTPDIGAFEWDAPKNDAGVLAIVESLTFTSNSDSVYVTIKNYGTDTLKSVVIDWKVNQQTQTSFTWYGNLPQGATYGPFSIGYYKFLLGTAYDISAYTLFPNNSSEGYSFNDMAEVKDKYLALNGTFTVGTSSSTFPDLNSAVRQLVKGGVTGPVVFYLADKTYNEQIRIDQIKGVSANNTVTFTSQSGDSSKVIITYDPIDYKFNYIFELVGCAYLTFSKISIKNSSISGVGKVLALFSSEYINFKNCIIQGLSASSQNYHLAVIHFRDEKSKSISFIQNSIQNGSYGVFCEYELINALFYKNEFINQYHMAMNFYRFNNTIIEQNSFSSNTSNSNYIAIAAFHCYHHLKISANTIKLTNGLAALQLNNCRSVDTSRIMVSNNFISVGGASASGYGINMYDSRYVQIYHNSIINLRKNTTACNFYVVNCENLFVANNIFMQTGDGQLVFFNNTVNTRLWDYNNYRTSNASFATYYNNPCKDLSSWISFSKFDSNSLFLNPGFKSVTDLHICHSGLKGAGMPIASVRYDIDNHARDTKAPDIGADEFSLIKVNLGSDIFSCDTVVLNAGNEGNAFLWSTNEITQKISVTKPGKYWVKVSNISCTSSDTIIVSNKPETLKPSIWHDSICKSQSVLKFEVNTAIGAKTYQWEVPQGWSLTQGQGTHSVSIKTGSNSGKICVFANSGCANSDTFCRKIEFYTKTPSLTEIQGQSEICEFTQNLNYSVNKIQGIDHYIWSLPVGWAITQGHGTNQIKVNAGSSGGKICVSATNLCDTSLAFCLNVNVRTKPLQPAIIFGDDTVCTGNDSIKFYVSHDNNVSEFIWNLPVDWSIINGNGTNEIIVSPSVNSGVVCVKSKNVCAESKEICKTVEIVKLPEAVGVISGNNVVCAMTKSLIYEIGTVNHASSYVWNFPSDWSIVSGQGTKTVMVNAGNNSGNINVFARNVCGDGADNHKSVEVKPVPPKPMISQNGDSLFSSSDIGNQWYEDANIIAGANDKIYLPSKSGWYKVKVTNIDNCSSESELFRFIHSSIDGELYSKIYVYPNPSESKMIIQSVNLISELYIYNVLGEIILKRNHILDKIVELEQLDAGIYLARIVDEEGNIYIEKTVFR